MSHIINFRPAEQRDSARLISWRNDPKTRAFSIHTDVVSQEDHDQWFSGIVKADPARAFIAEEDGVPVGTVRRDIKGDGVYLSWTVNPECRGLGIGESMVDAFLKEYPSPYKAFIKEDNNASIRIAEKCGFTRSGVSDGLLIFIYAG
jgi:RimJ/RimL family protein N-acetyltransferase